MNSNLIKAKLKLKHEEFISSLFHQETKDLIKNKSYFAGGCIRDLYRDKEPKDYDLYFFDDESRIKFMKLAENEFQFKKTSIGNFNSKKIPIQVITILALMPEAMVNTFDFTINQGYYIPQLDILQLGDTGNTLVAGKQVFTPIQALLRAQRFLKEGYLLPSQTIIELSVQISKNRINTEEELKHALMGMSYSEIFDGNPEVKDEVFNNFLADDIPF